MGLKPIRTKFDTSRSTETSRCCSRSTKINHNLLRGLCCCRMVFPRVPSHGRDAGFFIPPDGSRVQGFGEAGTGTGRRGSPPRWTQCTPQPRCPQFSGVPLRERIALLAQFSPLRGPSQWSLCRHMLALCQSIWAHLLGETGFFDTSTLPVVCRNLSMST